MELGILALVLVVLACPVAMGVMMWRMNRASSQHVQAQGESLPPTVEALPEQQRLDEQPEPARAERGRPVTRS